MWLEIFIGSRSLEAIELTGVASSFKRELTEMWDQSVEVTIFCFCMVLMVLRAKMFDEIVAVELKNIENEDPSDISLF